MLFDIRAQFFVKLMHVEKQAKENGKFQIPGDAITIHKIMRPLDKKKTEQRPEEKN